MVNYSEMIKLAHDNREEIFTAFLTYLEKKMGEAKDTLIERFNHIASQPVEAAKFMWENNTMAGYVPEEGPISALKHGTLAVGQIALAETLQILIGKDQCEDEGMELAKQIESLFAKRCDEFKEEYKLNFGVYYSPSENLCHTSFKKFVAKYGLIENVTAYRDANGKLVERGYFTNSIHVPVWKKIDPFKKIDIESQLTGYSSAGCITYVDLDETAILNEEAVMQIVENMLDSDCPYNGINIPDNRCSDCGYNGKLTEDGKCPKCGSSNTKMMGRVTGYITGDYRSSFNLGKQMEFKDRVKHNQYIDDGSWLTPQQITAEEYEMYLKRGESVKKGM